MSVPGGGIHPQLQPVFDTLLAGPRPQTTLYWTTRSSGPDILRRMAIGDLPISHHAFDELPVNRVTGYVRSLLAATGVLPPFNAELERVPRWIHDLIAQQPPPARDVLRRYGAWQVMRRLRRAEDNGTLTHGGILAARNDITNVARLLSWLHDQQLTLAQLTQPALERYATEHPARASTLKRFLGWAYRSHLSDKVGLPVPARGLPTVRVGHRQRWDHVETLLHDESIRLYVRIAGLFILLYAQPVARVCRMRRHQITLEPEKVVTVTFDRVPIELPEPMNHLLIRHLAARGQASYVSRPEHWLFPGGIPGQHLATENIRGQLVARGITPGGSRSAALYQLAADMPVPVLADLLGVSVTTATRWAALAGRDWATYTAMRYHDEQPDPGPAPAPTNPE
jgi:hypothetical protein